MDDQKIEFKLDEETGNLTVNIFEYVRNLPDEKKEELLYDGGWWNFIEDDLVFRIIDSFSREHYNPNYHQFRTKIINSDAMPKIIRKWAETMIVDYQQQKRKADYWQDAFGSLYAWAVQFENCYKDGYSFNVPMPKLPERHYSYPYPYELIEEAYNKIKEWETLFPEPKQND